MKQSFFKTILLNGLALVSIALTGATAVFADPMGTSPGGVISQAGTQVPPGVTILPGLTANAETAIRPNMIGNNYQMAPVYECWFALRQSYLNTPNSEGPHSGLAVGGSVVSDWNYLASDPHAFNVIGNTYGSNFSVSSYFGLGDYYGRHNGYGRGGQCVSFAALILYRCRNYPLTWLWPTSIWSSSRLWNRPSARNSQPGDLVFYMHFNSRGRFNDGHVGVVVKQMGNGIDVVDSNYVGYGSSAYAVGSYYGVSNSEMIGRHFVSNSQLGSGGWKVYSGRGLWY